MPRGQKMHTPASVWALVDKSGDGCWEWRGNRSSRGYGDVSLNGKMYRAHRVIAFLAGLIPALPFDPERCVLHRCDNRACCRPDHFFIGTHADNNHDAVKKGRNRPVIGDKNGQAKMSNDDFLNAMKLLDSGQTKAAIARMYGVSREALGERIKRHQKRGGYVNAP